MARADDGREPLQAAQVGDDRHLRLAHREHGVGRRQSDVARRDEVDAAADAVAVHGGDHRLGAARHRGDGVLQPEHLGRGRPGPGPPWTGRRAGAATAGVVAHPAGERAPHRLEVEPDREVRPLRRDHHGPHRGSSLTAAMARGRSRQRSIPMALRASARSSHKVATRLVPLDAEHRRLEIRDVSHAARLIAAEVQVGPGRASRVHGPHSPRDPKEDRPCTRSAPRPPPPWRDRAGSATGGPPATRPSRRPPLPSERRGGLALHAHRRPGSRRFAPVRRRRADAGGDQLLAPLAAGPRADGGAACSCTTACAPCRRDHVGRRRSPSGGPTTCAGAPTCWARC